MMEDPIGEEDYDENLQDNPFLTNVERKHPGIFQKVKDSGWVICVPRRDVARAIGEPDETLVRQHVLVPVSGMPGISFRHV